MKAKFILSILIIFLINTGAVFAQNISGITDIDLGVDTLTMEVGESYTFQIPQEQENHRIQWLNWYISDDSILSVDSTKATVTALSHGKAGILVESRDKQSYAICRVTVNGEKTETDIEEKSGLSLLALSETDRKKITSVSINRYLDFLDEWSFSAKAYSNATQRIFNVGADVTPGTEEPEAERAQALGIDSVPLPNLNAVTLVGTIEQILSFVQQNDDIIEVFELSPKFIIDPIEEEFTIDSLQKSMNLRGNTENLTSISTAHALGYKGDGAVIAVIDTGLNSSHEQFTGRVIAEKCFSTGNYQDGDDTFYSVCASNASSADSAAPSGARYSSHFTHGSHVAGIMAGRDGIAPNAKIVAIQGFSEISGPCAHDATQTCYDAAMLTSDELKAYDYLIDFVNNNGIKITAVNMSYGTNASWSYSCERAINNPDLHVEYLKDVYPYMQKLINAGIIPVSSSGNSWYDQYIGEPACLSNVFSVGALADMSTPFVAPYSNHANYLDITAPGTNIYSALYPSGYGYKDGTSMATPMVTGALAIVEQAYPYNSISDYEQFLLNITSKTVSKRSDGWSSDDGTGTSFPYTKPVLNFSNLGSHVMNKLTINDSLVKGYDQEIVIPISRDTRASGYNVVIYDPSNSMLISPAIDAIDIGDKTTIRLSGSKLVNGNTYQITINRYHTLGGIQYKGNSVTTYGTPVADDISDPVIKFVKRCYRWILGREADPSGLINWTNRIKTGGYTAAQVIEGFIYSGEFQRKTYDHESIVEILYNAMLGRASDPPGKANKTALLNDGFSYRYLIKNFAASLEFKNVCSILGIDPGTVMLTENRDQNLNITCFVSRLYKTILKRSGDVSGLNNNTGILLKNKNAAALVEKFIYSQEFQRKTYDNESFVEILYNAMLGRGADHTGKANKTALLNDGVSYRFLIKNIAASQEFKNVCSSFGIDPGTITLTENRDKNLNITRFVTHCYRSALNRGGDVGGLNNWTGRMLNGRTPQDVAYSFVFSAECQNRNLNNEDFVRMLYRLYLNREPDQGGFNNWINRLKNGMTRQQVVNGFGNSLEFKKVIASYGL